MNGLELQHANRVFDRGDTPAAEALHDAPIQARRSIAHLMPVDEDVARVGLELDEEPSLAQLGRRPDELLAAARLTKDHEHPSVGGNPP